MPFVRINKGRFLGRAASAKYGRPSVPFVDFGNTRKSADVLRIDLDGRAQFADVLRIHFDGLANSLMSWVRISIL
jgi:hypothetical protein